MRLLQLMAGEAGKRPGTSAPVAILVTTLVSLTCLLWRWEIQWSPFPHARAGVQTYATTELTLNGRKAVLKDGHESVGEKLARAAGLKTRMPFYLMCIGAFVKPIFYAVILGPQRPGEKAPWVQIIALIVIPFAAALKADLELVRMIFALDEVSSWACRCGLLMILGNSSILTSLGCQVGTLFVAMFAMKWRVVHSPYLTGDEYMAVLNRRTDAMTLGLWYCSFILLALETPCLVVACLPALLAYFYITLPFLFLVAGLGLAAAPRCLLGGVRLSVSAQGALPDCLKKRLCSCDAQGVAEQGYDNLEDILAYTARERKRWLSKNPRQAYDEEKEYFNEMGAPKCAYDQYFFWAFLMLVFPWASAATARLLVGTGYWAALWDTWDDRHLRTFLKYSVNASVDAMGEAAEATETVHGWLIVAQRWLVVLNHFI